MDERELQASCRRVAGIVSRDYSAVEAEDLEQELFLEAWRVGDRVENLDAWLFKAANGIAADLHEKVMKCKGYSQYEYTSAVVRRVLEYSFTYTNWESLPLPDSARSAPRTARAQWDEDAQADVYQQVNDPTDARDVAADIQRVLDLLGSEDRQRIISRYKYGIVPDTDSEKKKLYRAVDKLTKKLNAYRGLTEAAKMSGRKAMTNAAAIARIQGLTD